LEFHKGGTITHRARLNQSENTSYERLDSPESGLGKAGAEIYISLSIGVLRRPNKCRTGVLLGRCDTSGQLDHKLNANPTRFESRGQSPPRRRERRLCAEHFLCEISALSASLRWFARNAR